MKKYDYKKIEKKWQKFWEDNKTFETCEDDKKEKFYSLIEFPYPSGVGLHVGHPRPFTAMDVISRQKRMDGKNVLYPIGFDAFGLPTENFAIKTGRPPVEVTAENIANFTRQLKMLGYSFDWSRTVDTTDPNYYKWTQWIFLKFFKHGLAYKKNIPINWCLSCKIGLANEEVVEGKCERCGGEVEKRNKEQWMLGITKYADKLLDGLDEVDYIERARKSQTEWIGRSEGATVMFEVVGSDRNVENDTSKQAELSSKRSDQAISSLQIFTTRPDTLFGATYMVISPEHELLENSKSDITNYAEVEKYVKAAKLKSDLERTELQKEKTGIEIRGIKAINPVNNEHIPIFVADYVLSGYGTGAIMAVPAHDTRDWEFAKKYDLELREVVSSDNESECFSGEGVNVNSGFLDGLETSEATQKMIEWLEEKQVGKSDINYKLRDWVFSRQRYWGDPIPLVHCESCEKNANKDVLLLHGWDGGSKQDFFPYLKNNLEEKGYNVHVVDMPNTAKPVFEEWNKYVEDKIKEYNLNDFILLGHSMGGHLAMKLAEKHKLAKLVLVTPVGFKPSDDYFNSSKKNLSASDREIFKKFQDNDLDVESVKKNVKDITFLFGEKDEWINEEIREFYQNNFKDVADISILTNIGHITDGEKVVGKEFVANVFPDVSMLGWKPLSVSQLPLELPKVAKYEPTDTGESPLANIDEWVNTTCPQCGGDAQRETDTMPNWAGSSWYFLRYCDTKNTEEFAGMDKLKYWMGVDWYNGGMEHTVLHLLYSRFWNLFMYDIGLVPTKEPYKKRTSHGMILGEDGEKMSKSRGNVINPDDMVEKFGTDAFRVYIMFMGPFDQTVNWDTNGMVGTKRFLDRVWALQEKLIETDVVEQSKLHQIIKKVSDDIEKMRFNTAIAKMMEYVNDLYKQEGVSRTTYETLVKLLSPFAPHLCEEIWETLGNTDGIAYQPWPKFDESKIIKDTITLAIQINGKLRDTIEMDADISEQDAKTGALASKKVQKWMDGVEPKKVIYVKGKLVSIVI